MTFSNPSFSRSNSRTVSSVKLSLIISHSLIHAFRGVFFFIVAVICVVNINFHVFLFNWNQSFGGQEPLLMFMFLALLVVLIQLVSGNRCPIKYLLNETRNEWVTERNVSSLGIMLRRWCTVSRVPPLYNPYGFRWTLPINHVFPIM